LQREQGVDPMLEDVLNEVDVRAAVELAKREVAEARVREGV
jgi:Class II flagellar assembly regulator